MPALTSLRTPMTTIEVYLAVKILKAGNAASGEKCQFEMLKTLYREGIPLLTRVY